MRKLAPARVSYRDEFLISYRIYIMVISYLVIWRYTMLIKYTCDSKSQTLRMRYPFQSTSRPISHRNRWSFCVYMIPLRVFVPEWNSRPGTTTGVNSRRGDLRRHVSKCRAREGTGVNSLRGESRPGVMLTAVSQVLATHWQAKAWCIWKEWF